MAFVTGTWLGRYEIVRRLGAGGMGEVYLAEDKRLNRKVALKFLPAELVQDELAKRRLLREAQAAARLDHPNICSVHEAEEENGRSFIVMQYIEGETLATRIQRQPLELHESLEIAAQIADALAEAHSHAIIHRDIKPQNIMITTRGQAKVMDFGLVKVISESSVLVSEADTQSRLSESGTILGTVPYMSPEQVRGEVLDARSDIFSFGCVLYEMISARQPFLSDSKATTISAILTQEPMPLARYSREIPPELERIVSKALAKPKEERYQTIKDLLIDLKKLKNQLELDSTAAARSTASSLFSRVTGRKLAVLAVTILAMIGIGVYFLSESQKPIDSVAVLPFTNVGADPNTEYLSDGITESLINSLSQVSTLRVLPRSTVFRYKGREVDPQTVGNDLKVSAVLTGRVLQRGDTLNIQTELIDVEKESQLWGDQYNRKLTDILAVQEEITKEISGKLQLKLTGKEQEQLARRYTESTEAYQLYLKGRYFATKWTEEGFNKAIAFFHQAIAIDPNYALAYDGLAYCYYVSWYEPDYKESIAKARAFAKRALEIDPTLAEAHVSLGIILTWDDHDWSAAEEEFRQALELKPNYAPAHLWYGWYLQTVGRSGESLAEQKRAVELDPLSAEANTMLGIGLFYARKYDEANDQLRRVLELEPNFWFARLYLGRIYVQKGDLPRAIAELEKTRLMEGATPEVLSALGYAYALSEKKDAAQGIITELKEESKRFVPPYTIAIIYAGLGEKDRAFEFLEREYKESFYYLNLLKVDPELNSLRSDPRFADLLRRMNLAPR